MSTFKVVLVGASNAGKTSIIGRYINNQFMANVTPSVQAACLQKRIQLENETVSLDIWDTAGQEKFHSLAPIYYRNAAVVLIVFDLTDASSFAKAKDWMSELQENLAHETIVLVANKCDMQTDRVVPASEVTLYAEAVGVPYVETSAKTGYQIAELFEMVAREAYTKRDDFASQKSLRVEQQNKQQGCC